MASTSADINAWSLRPTCQWRDLSSAPRDPDLAALTRLKARNEAFALEGKVFYLHTPDGSGDSRLAAAVERQLGVAATARNWRTVARLLEMVGDHQ